MKFKFLRFLIILVLVIPFSCNSEKSTSDDSVIANFNNIENNPTVISYINEHKVNNKGGHLQGVQLILSEAENYVYLTGSSDSYSYYSVVRLGTENEVISVNKLMDKPFKHAGGHQVFSNFMAIGIEDNLMKNKSKVCIYDVSQPEKALTVPLAVIEREGEPKRETAGCVGFTKYKDQALIVVGNWNTEYLDLYTCKYELIGHDYFEKTVSIKMDDVSKKMWVDKNWEAYQNINLFTFNGDQLYLIGLGHDTKDKNIADLFRLTEESLGSFKIEKLARKIFNCENGTSFKAGGGVVINKKGKFQIYACDYNMENISYLNLFDNSGNYN